MELILIGHSERYPLEQLQQCLFPENPKGTAISRVSRGKCRTGVYTEITIGGQTGQNRGFLMEAEPSVRDLRRKLQQSYYRAALSLLPASPPWGALAGVRPTKLSSRCLLAGETEASALRLLGRTYYVTAQRQELAMECSRSTLAAAKHLRERDVSLYVGIPFCPTRCVYCSFVSRTVGKNFGLMGPYLDCLGREIQATAQALREADCHVRTVYIGGGTPTTLSEGQLSWLLSTLRENFDLSQCLEFTVEAGRPDTLNAEKLRILRENGVDRISINPQSMEDSVLHACGRPHTAAQVEECFRQAEALGFSAINMDLIAGLPTDTAEGFRRSLDTVAALHPANITVHTLALKKGADLFQQRQALPPQEEVAQMLAYAGQTLRALGYKPYYLYRQKYMSGSFENVGWSRDGLDCLYNICMMEELHTIISLGGGGMSKLVHRDGSLERCHNPKFPEQYIEGFDRVLERKRELIARLAEEPPFPYPAYPAID